MIYGALTDRPQTVPIAACIAQPAIWGWVILMGALPLMDWRRISAGTGVPRSTSKGASFTVTGTEPVRPPRATVTTATPTASPAANQMPSDCEHAPKAYELGRLFAGYQGWGADPLWFLDPPGEVRVDPVRDRQGVPLLLIPLVAWRGRA